MKYTKELLVGALSLSLLVSIPYHALANGGQSYKNAQSIELIEAEKSLFNNEHYDFLKYSEIGNKLQEIAKQSNRITVEVKGKSSQGHDMYVVTVSDPSAKGKYGHIQALRKQMFKNPEKAQDWIAKNPDFKVPVMINASVHGTEYVGTDAAIQLIEQLATQNDDVTTKILENNILIFNVVANPDGRVDGTRFNGNGIDLNRDFITQSQPETKLAVELMTEWNPMVLLDLHGYVKNYGPNLQGLIEPCTPPHNPNYEYDLFIEHGLAAAEAMEAEIMKDKETEFTTPLYENMVGSYIPYRDDAAGWDDYPPIFTPMYAMYHGSFAHTLEAPTNDENGVKWTYDAMIGALTYASENRTDMITDQIEIFKRGIQFDHPTHDAGFFPKAYILPVDEQDPTVTKKAVNHLITNDIKVEEAKKAFTVDGVTYPAGTFLVSMDQAKAGLANTMLWDGEDISEDTTAMYDISAWSLPELWGFEAIATQSDVKAQSVSVNKVNEQGKLVGKGPFLIPNTSVKAVNLVNSLLSNGVTVEKGTDGTFYFSGTSNVVKNLVSQSGLTINTTAVPADTSELSSVKVAILKDGGIGKVQSHAGTKLSLERLGFDVTELHPRDVATQGLEGYDVFVYSATSSLLATSQSSVANRDFWLLNADQLNLFKENVNSFLASEGKYISVGALSADATKTLGLTNVTVNKGGSNSNGIVKVDYSMSESAITNGYGDHDLGFVYRPAYFTNVTDTKVIATYEDSEDFFVAGHWRNRTGATGEAVIVQEKDQDVTLIGLEPGFRDHTDYLFRLLSNTIFE
ncbi:M14 family zinc carboxypeptidase [Litchfieldia salsa]|uniref:Zinc carboxypeptidase n=1 Tax=Litchfieldia salsa TaxID=930152 RepID=A0A1H0W560_9BACI|nr:M14 family zinc carboxypeptidase [Litchfieldia salsa]SDP85872.1 Zinc carboxypeptidase [Litchfieldia salsa]